MKQKIMAKILLIDTLINQIEQRDVFFVVNVEWKVLVGKKEVLIELLKSLR